LNKPGAPEIAEPSEGTLSTYKQKSDEGNKTIIEELNKTIKELREQNSELQILLKMVYLFILGTYSE